ncbi:FCD domain-containing protein [Aquamicrobium sp.]|uniref:GntR family transcriptional regulator n=1 Tax=Aquamicrobium sp. TaxID=1872579 RepID=UPI0025832926|nr:FCD domain-containing protein [Aquamicrobium sp.]MCK9550857.1 FCD domain-containing protein [Aquamicrobium sp.]
MLARHIRRSLANDLTVQLREDILTGRKQPGEYLRLQSLSEEFQVSLSPIRETLSVLSNEGLVIQIGQRGYKVAPLLRDHLIDATRARIELETLCLRKSIEEGDNDWAAGVVSSYWKLNRIEQDEWTTDSILEWESCHHDFHEALVAGCNSVMLVEFCGTARRVTDRFRRIRVQRTSPDQLVWKEHETIYDLAINRHADDAVNALSAHIQRASDRILQEHF